jgi:hypothetical protein
MGNSCAEFWFWGINTILGLFYEFQHGYTCTYKPYSFLIRCINAAAISKVTQRRIRNNWEGCCLLRGVFILVERVLKYLCRSIRTFVRISDSPSVCTHETTGNVRFEVLKAVNMWMMFSFVTPREHLGRYQCFRGTGAYCLHRNR